MDTEVIDRLARIETKLDAALKVQSDHETRIRTGETRQWTHTGFIAAVSLYLHKFGFTLPTA